VSHLLAIQSQVSLKAFNSFHIEAKAEQYLRLEHLSQLKQLAALKPKGPILILGGGSNLLFTEDFQGLLIHNRLLGKQIVKSDEAYVLTISAGENWHELIEWTMAQGLGGLENLAAIPGSVGAAPVQNIGAYGCDFAQFCHSVETFNLASGEFETLLAADCQFAYRNSIFKTSAYKQHIITAVCLHLPLNWQPNLDYGPLRALSVDHEEKPLSPLQIFSEVVSTREQKLPDPDELGNAGSFFKNPQVSNVLAERLKQDYPNMPAYPAEQLGKTKLAAGWLIDQCQLKGVTVGGAQVHKQQALVLVNTGEATSQDIITLAKLVQQKVFERFAVELEPEVRMMASKTETYLV